MLTTSQACLATSSADLGILFQRPRHPISKRNPPTCCLINCEAKEVVYHQVSYMDVWWYTILLASQLIRQQVGGFLFDVGRLERCKSMPRSAKDIAKHAEDVAKHAEVGRGHCQACLECCKHAYTSQVPTNSNVYN